MDREGFRSRLKQYKKAREENPGLKYYDFMERLAEFKAKEWQDDPDMVLQHMLNDNTYNYQQLYEDNPNFNIQKGHFDDEYKTVYHPTFSEESRYSGKRSEYNPEGIVGGSWDTENKRFYLNDRRQSRQKALDYLNHADPGYQAIPKYDEGTGGVKNNLTKYWEWKLKYDSAVQPDELPSKPQPNKPLSEVPEIENISHRADNTHTVLGRLPLDSPYEDARYYDYRKPRFEFRKGAVHYSNPNLLKWVGRLGKVTRGGSILGEIAQLLFPSEEAELIENLRVKMDKQNKQLTGLEDIPTYDEGTNNVTYDPIELQRNLQKVLNTTPEGEVNPFYNSLDDTYGTANIPEVVITAPYTRKASLAQQAKRGAKAYYDAGKKAAPLLATIPLSAGILGTASTLGWGTAMDLVDIATNPTDPLSYIDKFDIATFKKVDPMSKNAKPISDKVFIDDTRVAGSTTTKPTYLDYGTVSFEDNILNERPQWVKDVQEFYDTDVMIRERNAASTAGFFYHLPFAEGRSKLTFNNKRPVYIREYLDDVDFGGYASKDRIIIDKNAPFSPDEILVHEGAHFDQWNGKELPFDLMLDSDIRETIANFMTDRSTDLKYKSFLLEKLDNAYEFTEDFGKNISKTLEKGATNREMRYNLWLKNNKPNVNELDNIIDGMSDDDIIYMLTQTNAYSRNVHKNLLEKGKDKKDIAASIRTALKTVPMLGAPIILNSTNDDLVSFAEGGQVEPDPLEVLEASRPKAAGIPINDKPLSGTDPVGEAMMWGLGGGAASAALRSLFPTYGATAAWLAFGDNNKDNMLIIPTNPTKNNTPIETGLLNKEVRQYYADDVLPRDILNSEQDKLRFLNNNKNFEYDLYPSEYFNPGVVGHYDHVSDKIRLNDSYLNNKDLLDNIMSHEVNHRYNTEFPLDKEHSRILNRAYSVQSDNTSKAARAAKRQSEKRATNVNIRHKLQTDLRNSLGRTPTKTEMDDFIDSLSDLELLDRLGHSSAYGAAYLMSIEDRADLVNQPADQYKKARVTKLRKALKRIAMNETENDNNQNYA